MVRCFRPGVPATAALVILGFLLAATPVHAKLNIVATLPDLAAIAGAVGGNLVEITTLARPTEDAHFVDPKPSFIVKLNRAQALIEGGAELELGWLPPLLESSRNTRIAMGAPGRINASEGIQMLEVPAALDRSKGDVHALGNPHFLTDPVNAKIAARHIAESLGALDRQNAATYQANAQKFADQIDAKLPEWERLLAPYKGRRIVAYHNAWPYFTRRFGLRIDLFLEPKPGIPPSPAHLAGVIATIKRENIQLIFVDPYVSQRTAEMVARNTGAKVVPVSYFPGGLKGTDGDYIKLMDTLVKSVAGAFEGK